jgi:hypothetical protein
MQLPRLTTRRMMVVVAVVAIALGMVIEGYRVFLEPGPSSLRATEFARIKPGLTREQVSDLLGGRPGDYGKNTDGFSESGDGSVIQVFFVPTTRPVNVENWQDDRNHFFIFFDDNGHVVAASKSNYVRRYPKSSFQQRMRQFFRLLKF